MFAYSFLSVCFPLLKIHSSLSKCTLKFFSHFKFFPLILCPDSLTHKYICELLRHVWKSLLTHFLLSTNIIHNVIRLREERLLALGTVWSYDGNPSSPLIILSSFLILLSKTVNSIFKHNIYCFFFQKFTFGNTYICIITRKTLTFLTNGTFSL